MDGELELNNKEGVLVNCTSTGPWKETEIKSSCCNILVPICKKV